jgi:hypothetical protein
LSHSFLSSISLNYLHRPQRQGQCIHEKGGPRQKHYINMPFGCMHAILVLAPLLVDSVLTYSSPERPPAFRYPRHLTSHIGPQIPVRPHMPRLVGGIVCNDLMVCWFIYFPFALPHYYFPRSLICSFLFWWEIPSWFVFICIACGQPGRQRSFGRRKGGHATHPLPPHPPFFVVNVSGTGRPVRRYNYMDGGKEEWMSVASVVRNYNM